MVDTDGAHCSLRLRHSWRLALLEKRGGKAQVFEDLDCIGFGKKRDEEMFAL